MTTKSMNPRAARAWQAFQDRVTELGGTVLEPGWLGSRAPHRVRCAKGHEGSPNPNNVQGGSGICFTCSGRNPSVTEAAFRALVTELGGVVHPGPWLGTDKPCRIRCAEGHEVSPHPGSVLRGLGICRVCAGRDSGAAWQAFQSGVADQGGVVLEPAWQGVKTPHAVRCGNGHTTTVRPGHVRDGNGICRYCKGREWDVFYVVVDDIAQTLKFGISSRGGSVRLRNHEADGFDRIELLLTDLPGTSAPDAERAVKALLAQRGAVPVRGAEYFPLRWLPTVMQVAATLPR